MKTKFRIWDLKNLFWIDSNEFDLNGKPLFEPNFYQEFEIQQFTGALDKNGKEIYHGDILSVRDIKNRKYYNGEVIWSEQYYTWLIKIWIDKNMVNSEYWSYWLYQMDGKEYEAEIVGNINENSELLKNE